MTVKVISLARSADRRRDFVIQNKGLDFEFVDAVDGCGLSREEIAASGWFANDLDYTPGAYGCAMSHIRMWQMAMDKQEILTIAEDDAIFRGDFAGAHGKCLAQLGDNWDIVLWGWNFDTVLMFNAMPNLSPAVLMVDQDQMRGAIDQFKSGDSRNNLLPLDKGFGLPCYSISPAGAGKLLDLCIPLRKLDVYIPILNGLVPNKGIDVAMCQNYSQLAAYVSFPPLVLTRNEHEISTIQGGK